MWDWLAFGLTVGISLVLHDSSPSHPGPERPLDLIGAEDITVLGASAKYLAAFEKTGVCPYHSRRLGSLRALLSVGSPLAHENFGYIYHELRNDLCPPSIFGGTGIVSYLTIGNPVLPAWYGELRCKALGMAVEIWGDDGRHLAGGRGELVCTRHFSSIPLGFWNNPDDARFHDTYFTNFPGVWAYGDYAKETVHGGPVIHDRSDVVLNPGGVRIGTVEIYCQVKRVEEVLESIAISQDWQGGAHVPLFICPRDGVRLDEPLCERIRQTTHASATPRHVPAKIIQVADIPRTLSGKIAKFTVHNMVHGRPAKNTDALASPQALELYRDLAELRD